MRHFKYLTFASLGFLSCQSFAFEGLFYSNDIPTLQATTEYSDHYGSYLQAQYANEFTNDDVAAFLLGVGQKQFLVGITYAKLLSEHQRIKMYAQHFAQDNSFDFVTGEDHSFIGQTLQSVDYQYFRSSEHFFQAVDVKGYYGGANGGDFENVNFVQNDQDLLDIRNVAGGKLWGASGGFTLRPFIKTHLISTLNYDSVQYNTSNLPANNAQGVGYTVKLQQQITPRFQLNIATEQLAPYDLYSAGIGFALKNKETSYLDLGISASYLQSDVLPVSHDSRAMLNMTYRWGGEASTALTDLLKWTIQSPLQTPAVFVMQDERVATQ